MRVPRGRDLMCFSVFSCAAADREATTLDSGVLGVLWVGTLLPVRTDPHFWGSPRSEHYSSLKRHQTSLDNVICPLALALLSFPALFQLWIISSTWLARQRVGEQVQDEGDGAVKCVNGSVGVTSTKSPMVGRICSYILLAKATGTQHFGSVRKPGVFSN